jgi:hypothetical protein
MAADSGDAAEVAAIQKAQADIDARWAALAQKFGEGKVVMVKPGDPTVMIVHKGVVRTVLVTYLTGGGA